MQLGSNNCAFPPQIVVLNCPKAEPRTELIKLGDRDMWKVVTVDAKKQKPEAGLKSKIMTKHISPPAIANSGICLNTNQSKANLQKAHYVLKGVVETVRKSGKVLEWRNC